MNSLLLPYYRYAADAYLDSSCRVTAFVRRTFIVRCTYALPHSLLPCRRFARITRYAVYSV